MIPSLKLRQMISEKYNIDLDTYAWNDEFYNFMMNIKLDKNYEDDIEIMSEVYEKGFNIGNCGLTSRYLAINNNDALLHYGTCKLLVGTKSSSDGNHVWCEIGDYYVDTTLMLCIPKKDAEEIGYVSSKILDSESARMLPEYNTYSNEYYRYLKDKDYETGLYVIGNNSLIRR